MKIQFSLLACMLLIQFAAKAQMKIGDNPTAINSASLLELESTNKGLVFPRVSLDDVASPFPLDAGLITGTVVFNTNITTTNGSGPGLYVWNGSVWMSLISNGTSWSLKGNSGTNPLFDFAGTTDAVDYVVKTDSLERLRILGAPAGPLAQAGWAGMGTATPRSVLDIAGNAANRNVVTIQNTSNTGYSSVDMVDDAGNLAGTFGYANTGVASFFGGKNYFDIYGKDFIFTAGSSANFFLQGSTTGYIGINTPSPQQRLHVNGKFYLDSAFMPGGNAGTSGYVLTSSGPDLAPTWQPGATSGWSLTGNAGTNYTANFIGTTDNVGFRVRTNNIQRILVDSLGSVAIGSEAFDAANRERLLVDYGTTTSHTVANFKGSINDYFQINLQNTSSGNKASSDYVATADDGTDSTYFVNMGINGSNYNPNPENWGNSHDAYLYSNSRNLLIGTEAPNSDVVFLLGGGQIKANSVFRIMGPSGTVVVGRGDGTDSPQGSIIRGPNGNGTDITGGNLSLRGGSGTGTASGGILNLLGGGTGTGPVGAVNINTGKNGATNINTGQSLSNITLGGNANNILLPKFSTVGGLYYTSLASGQISTTGVNMKWDSINNRLGIGTTSPGEKLHVVGNFYLTGAFMPGGSAGTSGYVLTSSGASTTPTWKAATSLGSFSATAPLTYNNSTGVFGIIQAGTSSNGYLSSTDWNTFNNKGNGTVTSVGLSLPNIFAVSGSPVTTSGTLTGTLVSQSANLVFASPGGAAGMPSFRALTAADIPSLAGNYIQNQTGLQASSNFNISGNGTIGTNLSVNGTSTLTGLVSSNGGITNTGVLTSAGGIANVNASSNFATNINTGTSTGNVTIGSSSNNVNLPKLSASSVVLTDAGKNLTSTTPTSNTYLYYNGTVFTWQAATTLGSFSATTPLTYNNTTGVFAINKANTSTDGYLSSADWNTFNSKGNGTVTSVGLSLPNIFTVSASPVTTSGTLTGTLNSQSANLVFAGPASGVAAAPAFRTLVAADIPSGSGNYIQNQTTQQAFSNFNISGNGTIGTNLSVAGTSILTGAVTSNGGITNAGVLTSAGGVANINAGSNFATNINTGTSTASVAIGNSANNILLSKFNTTGGLFFTSAVTGQIGNTATDMSWDDVNDRLGIGTITPGYKLSVLGNNPLYLWGVQPTAAFATDSILTIFNGVVKKAPYSSLPAGSAWAIIGNNGTSYATNFLGTTDNISMRFRTNNIERMVIDSLGDVGIGSAAFDATNRERLLVDYGTTSSRTVAGFEGSINDNFRINMQNNSSGINATTNYVATADDGTESLYNITMGINGSLYAPATEYWGAKHDGYLFTNSKNLLIGTQANNSDVIFLLGGGKITANTVLRLFNSTGNIMVGKGDATASPVGNIIRGPNATGTNIAGGSLTLQGGSATGTATGGNLNLYGGAGVSGSRGAVNIIASALSISGVQATGSFTTDSILTIFNGVVKKASYSSLPGGSAWSLTGNSSVSATTNFIGTTGTVDLVTRTNNIERMRILGADNGSGKAGWIGIGITVPRSPVDMAGNFPNKNIFTIQNTSSTGYSSVDMFDNSGSLVGTFGYANSGTSNPFFSGRDYFNVYGNDFLITTNSNNYDFFLDGGSGYAGINTNTPSERLHVVGNFYLTGAFMPGGNAGTSGYVLTSAGAGLPPTWKSAAANYILNQSAPPQAADFNINGSGTMNSLTVANGIVNNLGGFSSKGAFSTSGGTVNINTSGNQLTNINTGANTGTVTIGNTTGNVNLKGALRLNGATSGYVGLQAAAAAGSTTYTLPAADGTSGQVLSTNGGGTLSWATASGGGSSWSLTGNSGINPANNFLGTTDAQPLIFKVSGTQAAYLGTSTDNRTLLGLGAAAIGMVTGTTAIGANAQANNTNATALGINAQAGSPSAIAIGSSATANGGATFDAIAIGKSAQALGSNSVAIGSGATTSAADAFILGNNTSNVGIHTQTPTANLDVNGNFKLGTSGTVLSNIIKTTVAIDPASITTTATVFVNVTVTGAAAGSSVIVNPTGDLTSGLAIAYAYVSAANTVRVGFINNSSAAIDPASANYTVTIMQ